MDLRIGKQARIRIVPPSRDGLEPLARHLPRAEAFVQRTAEGAFRPLAPALAWLYFARRRLGTIGVAILTVWFIVHVMFGPNGMMVYRQKKTEYQTLQKEVENLQQENDRYNQQIKALKTDPKTIEREAREQLHYARPGEVVYVSPAPPARLPATSSAHK